MTNQEAITWLAQLSAGIEWELDMNYAAALDMAIEALKAQELKNSTDTISRADAIDAINEQIEQCDKALSSFDISMKDEYAVKVERASLVAFRETLKYMPSAQPEQEQHEIGYSECAVAMLKMWIDNVLTDREYNRIMDKLNAHWAEKREE